jgi:hypothetical protein
MNFVSYCYYLDAFGNRFIYNKVCAMYSAPMIHSTSVWMLFHLDVENC